MLLKKVSLSRLIGRVAAAAYLCLFPLVGLIVAYIGLCDPDTCWHLALGRWMSEHNQLPIIDPFSSNIKDFVWAAAGRPIMQHEWLSDWIFYRIYAFGGATLLLVFVAAVSALALIISPSLLMVKSGTPRLVALTCVLAALPSSLFRLWVRPEVFSFAYLSTLIWLVEIGRRATAKNFVICVLLTFVLLALWANCHALFILGLSYMVLYLCLAVIQAGANPREESKDKIGQIGRILTLTLAAFCGTLCTPWQGALWQYVLRIVFSSAAHSNKENGPLTMSDLGHITVVPLAVSFILVALLFFRLLWRKKMRSVPVSLVVLPLGLYFSALACALLFRRFTPFALLILLTAVAGLFHQTRKFNRAKHLNKLRKSEQANDQADDPGNLSKDSSDLLDKWTIEGQYMLGRLAVPGLASSALGLFLAVTTCWLAATFLVKPEIPAPSRFFTPACQAMKYLSKQRPAGRMLNDSKLGSMITFCLANPPDIFIDGRFDSYSRQLIGDYERMRLAKPGYLDLLRSYKIDWIFFPPRTPLIDSLAKEPDWQVYYRDRDAIILTRVGKYDRQGR